MYELISRLLKHSGAYAVATVLNRAVSVVLLPLYTRSLTKAEYGMLEIITVTSTVVMLVLQLGMDSALFRSALYRQGVDRKVLTSTAHYFLMACALVAVSLLVCAATPLAHLLFGEISYARLLRIMFLGDFFLVCNTIPMARLRIDEKSGKFALIAGANFVLTVGLNVLFVAVLRRRVEGVVVANTVAALCFALIYTAVIWPELGRSFSTYELKEMLSFGLPLVPAAACNMVLMMSDRYLLRFLADFDQVALYSAGMRLGVLMMLVVSAFQLAWPAIFFPIARRSDGPQIFARLFEFFMLGVCTIALGLAIMARDLLELLATKSYLEGAQVVPLIVASFVLYGVYYYTAIGVQVRKKTYLLPLGIGVAAAINLFLGLYFVPRMGMMGAAWAKVAAYAVLAVVMWAISQRLYRVPYDVPKFALLIGIGAAFFSLSRLTPPHLGVVPVMERLVLTLAFPAVLLAVGYVDRHTVVRLLSTVGHSVRGIRFPGKNSAA
ncbi:MAG: oligosaccharide flippase family protein [candidate division KSB1 bacterium]|nr:oligosaccharide flippase family protein [candidate division KSB1 bacterium]